MIYTYSVFIKGEKKNGFIQADNACEARQLAFAKHRDKGEEFYIDEVKERKN